MRTSAPSLAVVTLAVLALSASARSDDEFQPLVEGTDPSQFLLVELTPESIQIHEDGEVRLTGKPNGYFATRKGYKNYVLEFEWMYERPDGLASDDAFQGNSGLLLNIEEPHKVWPRCIEFQLQYQEVGKIYRVSGATFEGTWDQALYKKAIKPVGQWNQERVTSKDGTMTCTLNGEEVTRGTKPDPASGQIGWQSEGVPIRFRNLRIKVLD